MKPEPDFHHLQCFVFSVTRSYTLHLPLDSPCQPSAVSYEARSSRKNVLGCNIYQCKCDCLSRGKMHCRKHSSRVHRNLVWKLSCPRPKETSEDREHGAAHHTNQSSVFGLTLHRMLSEQCCQDNPGHDPPSQHTFCPSSLREKAQELEDSYGQIWEQLLSNCDKTAERILTQIWAVPSKYPDPPLGFFALPYFPFFYFLFMTYNLNL
ncbi:uncharacterized protein LOC134353936 isoform X1 [Mobula hypostoma]|uniref:uncharacterized protein LOC134353936 isoform X1 n=1 Tax=Mobula hypostoma TaxID=723540 RepID=UPI002FC392F0